MGSYNEQYEKYYSALTRNKRAYYQKNKLNKERGKKNISLWSWSQGNYANKFIIQLSIVVFLL